jgi:hypothetical protein
MFARYKVVTNATEESEARATYSTVEYQPWLPSSWILQRLDGYSDKRWPHRLFDARPVDQDRYLGRIASNPSDRRRFLIDIFFQRRLYTRHSLPTEHDGLALTQTWNQFLVNVELKGLEQWPKLHSDALDKFETYSPYGACMRVYRWSRKEGFPCMVWADNCPQCHPAAPWVRSEEYERDGWVDRVSARLAQAISDHERLAAYHDDAAAAKGQQQGVGLVVLSDEARDVLEEVLSGLPAIRRRGIAAPSNEILRSITIKLILVIQQALDDPARRARRVK